jgi:hypothetical protein
VDVERTLRTPTARQEDPTMTAFARRSGAAGCAASLLGYALELVRQRGTCDTGDPSPDTLVVSVLLIVLGGGLLGLAGLVAWSVAVVRDPSTPTTHDTGPEPPLPQRPTPPTWLAPVLPLLSLLSVLPLFAASGGGPGAWFQYCGT